MPTELPARVRLGLLDLYDRSRRDLPWRGPSPRDGAPPEPYGVWISEVMLQQTRVEAVIPYYLAWMERFPDVAALAAAPLDDVLRVWEGLGYYARARNLHRAAQVVRDRLGGELPSTAAALRDLPGVGEYTAGAVASIARGERVPAVDGNVRRVLARMFDEPDPTPSWLRERATELVDPVRPGDCNQALMELGATVCVPRTPECARCPLADDCLARRNGTVGERPRPKRRAALPEREFGVAVLVRPKKSGPELLLVRGPEDGLLGGLWQFPTEPLAGDAPRAAAARAARTFGVATRRGGRALPARVQVYSHFRGIYHPFVWTGKDGPAPGGDAVWAGPAKLERLALSAAHRAIARAALASGVQRTAGTSQG